MNIYGWSVALEKFFYKKKSERESIRNRNGKWIWHTKETRQMARTIGFLERQIRYHRTRCLDLDVRITNLRHKIYEKLEMVTK